MGFFKKVFKSVKKAASSVVDAITDTAKKIVDVAKDIVDTAIDAVTGVVKGIGSAIGGIFGGFSLDIPGFENPGDSGSSVGAEGVLVTKTGTNLSIPVVYGFRRLGGNIIYVETNGTNNTYLYVIYVICEGEIEGFKRIMIDDTLLPVPNDKYGVGTAFNVTQGKFKDRLRLQLFTGTETQAQSTLANEAGSWGNATRKLPGVAYMVARYEWKKIETQDDADNNPYRGGIPNIKVDILGKKVYDVTTHNTGLDLSDAYADLTKTFSYNPVSQLLDYLMNPRYGGGLLQDDINADAFKIGAVKCNQQVTYSTGGQSGKILQSNLPLSTSSQILGNVKVLLSASRSLMPYIQGRFKVKIEDGGHATDITSSTVTSVYDVNEDSYLSNITMAGEQKINKFNKVIVKFVDPDKEFTEQQEIFTVASDVTSDGEDLVGEFAFPSIANPAIAQDFARMIYKKSRNQRLIQFAAIPALLAVEPGDIIRVSSTVLNLSNQTFRVANMEMDPDGAIVISAREHDATLYPYASNVQVEVAPTIFTPSAYNLKPIAQPTPQTPISVAPPNDPEPIVTGVTTPDPGDSSTVTVNSTTPPSTVNTILPNTSDILLQQNTVTDFINLDKNALDVLTGNTTSALHFLQSRRNNLNTRHMVNAVANTSGGFVTFALQPPADQSIDTFRVYRYNRQNGSELGFQERRIIRRTNPPALSMQADFIDNNTFLVIRYRNSQTGFMYKDGSTFTDNIPETGAAPAAVTFEGIGGVSQSGTNVDAYLNNYIQDKNFLGVTSNQTNQDLGYRP